MEDIKTVSVIGGDRRLIYTAKRFVSRRLQVSTFALPADAPGPVKTLREAARADLTVCGLPFSRDGKTVFAPLYDGRVYIKDLLDALNNGQTVFAGMPGEDTLALMRAGGADVINYYKDETLTLINAMLTAEALLGLLITALPCVLAGAPAAVCGYGRIGAALTEKLLGHGAAVTVFARSEAQRALAVATGAKALPFTAFRDRCGKYRALVNTVPAPVIGKETLANLPDGCLLIEAASAPYGIDAAAAKALGFPYISASGLPGKYAPETAGEAIADTVLRLCREVKYNGTS